jgi:hypothetical protein
VSRSGLAPESVRAVVRAALGTGRDVSATERLRGGTKKGVYRLTLDDTSTVVLYVWSSAENYWPARQNDIADPFSDASGIDLFEAADAHLRALGVRTPDVYLVDSGGVHHPDEVALVEDVRGGTLAALLRHDPDRAAPVLAELATTLRRMARDRSDEVGKLAAVDAGLPAVGGSCERMVLERALTDLAWAAPRDERIAAVRGRVEGTLREWAADVRPRTAYSLVHGELGPDHVMVDEHDRPVLIDIEGTMFFDVEWEHAFLRMRFGEHYRRFDTSGLDDRRLRFYALARHLSLVAGPLRLLDGDFPDRRFLFDIIGHHVRSVLDAVRQRSTGGATGSS